jgi:hypothetical protein
MKPFSHPVERGIPTEHASVTTIILAAVHLPLNGMPSGDVLWPLALLLVSLEG